MMSKSGIIWPEIEGMSQGNYLTSEKDGKWPSLEELRKTVLFEEYRVKKI